MGDWEAVIADEELAAHLRAQGYSVPTDIQRDVLPFASKHRQDVIIASQTGTGKTLCFAIPIIERLKKTGELQALVLTPTRELALQVEEHTRKINRNQLTIVTLVGGIAREKQERLLKRKPEVVIATPGRLWELINEVRHPHLLTLPQVQILVLDEADRMVEAGHFRELDQILSFLYNPSTGPHTEPTTVVREKVVDLNFGESILLEREDFYTQDADCQDVFVGEISSITEPQAPNKKPQNPTKRQTFLVSATLTGDQDIPLDKLMKKIKFRGKPKVVDLTQGHKLPAKLVERAVKCSGEEKDSFLYYFLKERGDAKTIIFVNTIIVARRVVKLLRTLGLSAVHLDGKMRQGKRLKQLDRFKDSATVLVATDVAGRGLDLPQVQNVVHYQLPKQAEVYIHRSGRTARVSRTGFALSVVGPADLKLFHEIQTSLQEKIPRLEVDHAKWQECVAAVRVAQEIVGLDTTAEIEHKTQSWQHENAELGELCEDDAPVRSQPSKKRRMALQSTLASLQSQEGALRGSVITPELFRLAQAKRLI